MRDRSSGAFFSAWLCLGAALALSTPAAAPLEAAAPLSEASRDEYRGTLYDHQLGMSLVIAGGHVTGVSFEAPKFADVQLEGTIDCRSVTLTARDAERQEVGVFKGRFLDVDPEGKLQGKLDREILQGTWEPGNGQPPVPGRRLRRTRPGSPDGGTGASIPKLSQRNIPLRIMMTLN